MSTKQPKLSVKQLEIIFYVGRISFNHLKGASKNGPFGMKLGV